jgi:hypothetical protein
MVAHLDKAQLLARSEVVPAPAATAWQDYNFELPPALHFATGALFIGFVSVLSLAFANPEMAVPFGVFVAFIGAFFAVPAIFVRSAPQGSARASRWSDFMEKGIAVEHGRCTGREATILVLMLPVLIFCWALAIATIAALV